MSDEKNGAFSEEARLALGGVLDEIVPPSADGRLPGAGEIGLADYVREAMRQTPEIAPMITQGLTTLAEIVRGRDASGFAALSKPEKLEILEQLSSAEPAFLPTLTFFAYAGYYQDGRVVAALGLEPRPPHPDGYDMPPNDLTLVEQVRRRPKLYRAV